MQRVQNATVSFVNRKYAKETNVLTLNWLPICERIEFPLHSDDWPKYLPLSFTATKKLRSLKSTSTKSKTIITCKTRVFSTFECTATQFFNTLHQQCRSITDYTEFCSQVTKYLKDKALARILEISNENRNPISF